MIVILIAQGVIFFCLFTACWMVKYCKRHCKNDGCNILLSCNFYMLFCWRCTILIYVFKSHITRLRGHVFLDCRKGTDVDINTTIVFISCPSWISNKFWFAIVMGDFVPKEKQAVSGLKSRHVEKDYYILPCKMQYCYYH